MDRLVRISVILVPMILVLVFTRLAYVKIKDKELKEKSVLRFPLFYRIVPVLWGPWCIIISIYVLLFQSEDWQYIIMIFCVFGLPFSAISIMWSMWKVEMKEDGFTYRNYFGVRREYKYDELEYSDHPKGLKWFFLMNGKKMICIAHYIERGDALRKLYDKAVKK